MRGLALLFVVSLAGCGPLHGHRATRWLNDVNPFAGPPGDKVVLRTYLLEQPAGDPFLTSELWTSLLKPLPPEKHALLVENGLRVGHLAGAPPSAFLALARQEDAVVQSMDYTIRAGEPKAIPVGGLLPAARFQTFADIGATPAALDLKDAETAMLLTGVPMDNGKVKVTLEPRVQHGGRQLGWKPTADATGFTWLDQKTQERFPGLACDVTLAPGEFVIVGPSAAPANTLGGACFLRVQEHNARMRVLVVQAVKLATPPPAGRQAGVIAAQAGTPVVRGQRP